MSPTRVHPVPASRPRRPRLVRSVLGGAALALSLALCTALAPSTPGAAGAAAVLPEVVPASAVPSAASGDHLVVASFNVKCANCYAGKPNELPWLDRRFAVIDQIEHEAPAVVGLQEASQGWLRTSEGKQVDKSQFEDLVRRLGSPWKLTNYHRNNCVRSTTPTGCKYKDQGASLGTKILYDSSKIAYYGTGGSRKLPGASGSGSRYAVWAIMIQRSTGKRFMVVNTHLEPRDASSSKANWDLRRRQALAVRDLIRDKTRPGLPVVLTGDLNSHKWTPYGNAPRKVFTDAGLVDPLGNADRSTKTAPGATVKTRIQTNVSSYNGFDRTAPAFDYVNGTYLDYVMTTPMRVSRWETVADLDSRGRFKGIIPSDHNMVRATLYLP